MKFVLDVSWSTAISFNLDYGKLLLVVVLKRPRFATLNSLCITFYFLICSRTNLAISVPGNEETTYSQTIFNGKVALSDCNSRSKKGKRTNSEYDIIPSWRAQVTNWGPVAPLLFSLTDSRGG